MLTWISNFSLGIAVTHFVDACNSTSSLLAYSHSTAFVALGVSATLIGIFSFGVLLAGLHHYHTSMSNNYDSFNGEPTVRHPNYNMESTSNKPAKTPEELRVKFFHSLVLEFIGATAILYLRDYLERIVGKLYSNTITPCINNGLEQTARILLQVSDVGAFLTDLISHVFVYIVFWLCLKSLWKSWFGGERPRNRSVGVEPSATDEENVRFWNCTRV
jgi:hypothetical protein